jgi:hypothetical protein
MKGMGKNSKMVEKITYSTIAEKYVRRPNNNPQELTNQ